MSTKPRRTTWAATAYTTRGQKPLHTTYVRAATREGALAGGRVALRLFVDGPFCIGVREASPQELGCVPAGSGEVSWV